MSDSCTAKKGAQIEIQIAQALKDRGWKVIAQNYRTYRGEIDLIALDPAGVLVAIEVRYRRAGRGFACESVSLEKQRRLERALKDFCANEGKTWFAEEIRFDMIAADDHGWEHFEHAW
jgi:putative endonuclease